MTTHSNPFSCLMPRLCTNGLTMALVLLLIAVATILTTPVHAQTTTLSIQVADTPDNQQWGNGVYSAILVPSSGAPGSFNYTPAFGGGPIPQSLQALSGTLDGSGTTTLTLTATDSVSPSGALWRFSVCPAATYDCYRQSFAIPASTTTLTITPPSIRMNGQNALPPNSLAYSDIEIASPASGTQYFNLTTQTQRQYNGTNWLPISTQSDTYTWNATSPSWTPTTILSDFVPTTDVTITRITVRVLNAAFTGCTTLPTIVVGDATLTTTISIFNNSTLFDSGPISQSFPANDHLTITQNAGSGCGSTPAFGGNVSVLYSITTPNPTVADIYLDPNVGSDTSTCGALTTPCASIAQAQTRIQTVVGSNNYANGIAPTVMLRGYHTTGVSNIYFLPSGVPFTSSDNGEHWVNYPGEQPIISGGIRLTGWTNIANTTVWTHPYTVGVTGPEFEALYYNDRRAQRPQLGWFLMIQDGANLDRFKYQVAQQGTILNTWLNLNNQAVGGATCPANGASYPIGNVEVLAHESFTMDRMKIKCIDTTSNREIYLTGSVNFGFFTSHLFLIDNVITGATVAGSLKPGQWFLDQSVNLVYYDARPGENPNTDVAIIPQVASPMISWTGVSNMEWRGITFSHDNQTVPSGGQASQQSDFNLTNPMLKCLNCAFTTFNRDTFSHSMGHALWLLTNHTSTNTTNDRIINNNGYDFGAGGVYLGDFPPNGGDTDANTLHNALVSNNHFQYGGQFYMSGDLIDFLLGYNSTISNNDLSYIFHNGIGVCIPTGANCAIGGVSGIRNMTISNNRVSHCGLGDLEDFGCIYIASYSGLGNVVTHNVTHDASDANASGETTFGGGNCLYVDNVSQDVTVSFNLAYNCSFASLRMSKGPQTDGHPNIVTNNVLAYGRKSLIHMAIPCPISPGAACLQFKATNNLLYSDHDQNSTPAMAIQGACGPVQFATPTDSQLYQSNMYFTASPGQSFSSNSQAMYTSTSSAGNCITPAFNTFAAWQALGEDSGSVIQAPPFANPSARDFTLTTSPGVGFVPFSLTQPGLLAPTTVAANPFVTNQWPITEFTNSQF